MIADPTIGMMTWNLQHAGAERTCRQVAWLAGQREADVVILTEVSHASINALATNLVTAGYTVCTPSAPGPRSVVIASRVGGLHRVENLYSGRMPHRLLTATLDLPGPGRCGMIGMYVPSRGPQTRRNVDKRAFQADVAAGLPTLVAHFTSTPVIVGGDLNVVEPGHVPHQPVFGTWEYDFYRAFAAAGLTDIFRHLHPTSDGHSWFGRAKCRRSRNSPGLGSRNSPGGGPRV